MPLTQSQMIGAVADRAGMTRADAKRALFALDEIVLEELGNAQKVRIGGVVQLTVRVKPARTKRKGTQPGDRRGDRHCREARKRRCPGAATGAREGGASLGAKGAAAARGVKRTNLAGQACLDRCEIAISRRCSGSHAVHRQTGSSANSRSTSARGRAESAAGRSGRQPWRGPSPRIRLATGEWSTYRGRVPSR